LIPFCLDPVLRLQVVGIPFDPRAVRDTKVGRYEVFGEHAAHRVVNQIGTAPAPELEQIEPQLAPLLVELLSA
jgi:hypothetical protein